MGLAMGPDHPVDTWSDRVAGSSGCGVYPVAARGEARQQCRASGISIPELPARVGRLTGITITDVSAGTRRRPSGA